MLDPKDYPNIQVGHVYVDAMSGASIGACLRDAIRLAADMWLNVHLEHNGKIWHVFPNDLMAAAEQEKEA